MIILDDDKRRILRPSYETEYSFHCTYKGHYMEVEAQETGSKYYAQVWASDGLLIVDGYFDFDTMESVILMCVKNILR